MIACREDDVVAAATPLRQVPIEIYAVASYDLKAVAISPRKGKSAILSSLNLRVAHFLDIPKWVILAMLLLFTAWNVRLSDL